MNIIKAFVAAGVLTVSLPAAVCIHAATSDTADTAVSLYIPPNVQEQVELRKARLKYDSGCSAFSERLDALASLTVRAAHIEMLDKVMREAETEGCVVQ